MTTRSNSQKVDDAIQLVRTFVPEFRIIAKTSSRLHRFIGWFLALLGIKNYMSGLWTIFGSTAAYPDVYDNGFDEHDSAWTLVLHEGWHAVQSKARGVVMHSALYLLPQLIGVVALLLCLAAAATGLWSWWLLLGLVFFAPLPALGRALIELQAYKVQMAVDFWRWGDINRAAEHSYIDGWLVEVFCGSSYFWMWPFKAQVRAWFTDWLDALRRDDVPMTPYFEACRRLAEKT